MKLNSTNSIVLGSLVSITLFSFTACKKRSFNPENNASVRSGPSTPGVDQNVGFPYGDTSKDGAAKRYYSKPPADEID